MKTLIIIFVIFLSLQFKTYAGPFADALSRCVVISTNEVEQTKLIYWVVRWLSEHPELKYELGDVYTGSQKVKADVYAAEIFTELLTNKCKNETYEAIKYEGDVAIENAFSTLGEVAMLKMLQDETVIKNSEEFLKYVDSKKFEELFGDLYNE